MTITALMTVIIRGEEPLVGSMSCWRSGEKCFSTGSSRVPLTTPEIDVRNGASTSNTIHFIENLTDFTLRK